MWIMVLVQEHCSKFQTNSLTSATTPIRYIWVQLASTEIWENTLYNLSQFRDTDINLIDILMSIKMAIFVCLTIEYGDILFCKYVTQHFERCRVS